MLKYGAALELHAPPRVLEARTALFFTPPPHPLLLASASPLIGNEFWQFRRARLNTTSGVTAKIKNKKKEGNDAVAVHDFFFALRCATRGEIRRCFREATLCHRKISYTRETKRQATIKRAIVPRSCTLSFSSHVIQQTACKRFMKRYVVPKHTNYFG